MGDPVKTTSTDKEKIPTSLADPDYIDIPYSDVDGVVDGVPVLEIVGPLTQLDGEDGEEEYFSGAKVEDVYLSPEEEEIYFLEAFAKDATRNRCEIDDFGDDDDLLYPDDDDFVRCSEEETFLDHKRHGLDSPGFNLLQFARNLPEDHFLRKKLFDDMGEVDDAKIQLANFFAFPDGKPFEAHNPICSDFVDVFSDPARAAQVDNTFIKGLAYTANFFLMGFTVLYEDLVFPGGYAVDQSIGNSWFYRHAFGYNNWNDVNPVFQWGIRAGSLYGGSMLALGAKDMIWDKGSDGFQSRGGRLVGGNRSQLRYMFRRTNQFWFDKPMNPGVKTSGSKKHARWFWPAAGFFVSERVPAKTYKFVDYIGDNEHLKDTSGSILDTGNVLAYGGLMLAGDFLHNWPEGYRKVALDATPGQTGKPMSMRMGMALGALMVGATWWSEATANQERLLVDMYGKEVSMSPWYKPHTWKNPAYNPLNWEDLGTGRPFSFAHTTAGMIVTAGLFAEGWSKKTHLTKWAVDGSFRWMGYQNMTSAALYGREATVARGTWAWRRGFALNTSASIMVGAPLGIALVYPARHAAGFETAEGKGKAAMRGPGTSGMQEGTKHVMAAYSRDGVVHKWGPIIAGRMVFTYPTFNYCGGQRESNAQSIHKLAIQYRNARGNSPRRKMLEVAMLNLFYLATHQERKVALPKMRHAGFDPYKATEREIRRRLSASANFSDDSSLTLVR